MRSFLSILSNPAWIAIRRLFFGIRSAVNSAQVSSSEKWLDVGCGSRPYELFFPAKVYEGVDIEESGRPVSLKNPDHFYDGKTLPFRRQTYDGVLCTQVLEHVPSPDKLLKEISRVLKKGGILILSAPFIWEEHEVPFDYYRFTYYGFQDLLAKNGFTVLNVRKTTGSIETLGLLLSVHLSSVLQLPVPGWGRLIAFLICFPIQLFSILMQKILPESGKLYLDCIILARKK
jgi:SAM-dependent methyltransferase